MHNHLLNIDPTRADEIAAAITTYYFRLMDQNRAILARFAEAKDVTAIDPNDLSDAADLQHSLPVFRELVDQLGDPMLDGTEDLTTVLDGFIQDKWNKHVRTPPHNDDTRRRDNAERTLLRLVADFNRRPAQIPAGLVAAAQRSAAA